MVSESIELLWQRVRRDQELQRPDEAANGEWFLDSRETLLLQELFTLISSQFRTPGDGRVPLTLGLREDTRRRRLVVTLQVDVRQTPRPGKEGSPAHGVSLEELRKARLTHIQTLSRALGISCTDMTSNGCPCGYTLVMPLPAATVSPPPSSAPAATATDVSTPAPVLTPTEPLAQPHPDAPAAVPDTEKKKKKRAELKQFFIASLAQDQEKLSTALQEGDWETVRKVAHQLKGCAASFGFPEVTEQARTLDELIKSERTTDYHSVCTTLLATLRQIA